MIQFVTAVCLAAFMVQAETSRPFLHGLFTDNMNLQRDAPCPGWGWAAPGAKVAV